MCVERLAKRDIAGLAALLSWPDGALDACVKAMEEFDGRWNVWWDHDGDHGPGYYAAPDTGHQKVLLHHSNIYILIGEIRQMEARP